MYGLIFLHSVHKLSHVRAKINIYLRENIIYQTYESVMHNIYSIIENILSRR